MDLYREEILEHYHNPSNKGKLDDYDFSSEAHNPTCGDEISIYIKVDADDNIADISFEGSGCAISQAVASMLTEHLKNKTLDVLKSMTKEDILDLLGIELSHARLKCALLSLEVAQKAINQK